MKEIDWSKLSFGYMKTDYNVRCYYRDGKWGELELCSEETLNIHMAATCLHYGQEAFEGLKAYRGKDGKIRVFRPQANAERLQSTCRGILMPELSTEKFCEAVRMVVKANERFIPPYESGASLYIRPLLIGTGAQVGVHPASEYLFVIFVTPVGPYFKVVLQPILMLLFVSSTVLLRWEPVHSRSVVTMLPVFVPIRWLTMQVMPVNFIWMPRKRNILMSVELPISSVSKITHMLHRCLLLSFLLLQTAA